MSDIDAIKAKVDLVDLVGQYVTLKKAGANYKASCPFHQEKTASLMVSPEKQIWKCFGCQKGGSIFDFVMETEHLEFGDALKLLADKAGITLESRTQGEYQTKDKKEILYQINRACAKVWQTILLDHPAGQLALKYLQGRGIKLETIKQFNLGYAPKRLALKEQLLKRGFTAGYLARAGSPEKFFDRIMFPIFDVLANPVGFTGRTLGSNEPKYLNSPETPIFQKSRLLYGLNLAKAALKAKNYVILVEGQMDVVALHQAGATNTVASSGTAITDTQLQLLSKYTPNFLLAFDNDQAGITTTKKVIELLIKLDLNSKVVNFGAFKDAGELFEKDPAAWASAVKTAKEGLDWWIDQEIHTAGPMQFIEHKKKVIQAILPVLAQVTEPTRLDHYVQRLAQAIGVKAEVIYESLKKAKQLSSLRSEFSPNSSKSAISHQPKDQISKPIAESRSPKAVLTNEEQLLALALAQPALIVAKKTKFEAVAWQSVDTNTVAQMLKKLYTDTTLTNSPAQLVSKVKNQIRPDLTGKIDSWQLWYATEWPGQSAESATELIDEKLAQLATKQYEANKETLARSIKAAQEQGRIDEMKKLLTELNKLTKK